MKINKLNNVKKNLIQQQSQSLSITLQCTGTITTTPQPQKQFDWSKRFKTHVLNQGQCGASYAIAAVGSVQIPYALKSGKLQQLSTQQVLDCSLNYGNQGCFGGFMDQSFWYMIDNGLTNTKNYQNKFVQNDKCLYVKGTKIASFIKCADVPSKKYQKLLSAVIQQPTTVAIDVSQLQFYSKGVYTGNCTTQVNQAMLVVGYGVSEHNQTYWKIKNSFGTDWGQDGYLYLEREQEDGPGKCGIHLVASVPQGFV